MGIRYPSFSSPSTKLQETTMKVMKNKHVFSVTYPGRFLRSFPQNPKTAIAVAGVFCFFQPSLPWRFGTPGG